MKIAEIFGYPRNPAPDMREIVAEPLARNGWQKIADPYRHANNMSRHGRPEGGFLVDYYQHPDYPGHEVSAYDEDWRHMGPKDDPHSKSWIAGSSSGEDPNVHFDQFARANPRGTSLPPEMPHKPMSAPDTQTAKPVSASPWYTRVPFSRV